jgi:hypothetical protein
MEVMEPQIEATIKKSPGPRNISEGLTEKLWGGGNSLPQII